MRATCRPSRGSTSPVWAATTRPVRSSRMLRSCPSRPRKGSIPPNFEEITILYGTLASMYCIDWTRKGSYRIPCSEICSFMIFSSFDSTCALSVILFFTYLVPIDLYHTFAVPFLSGPRRILVMHSPFSLARLHSNQGLHTLLFPIGKGTMMQYKAL